jgi:ubiquinone/menaquinone biosynthesis C-methylase UbiE
MPRPHDIAALGADHDPPRPTRAERRAARLSWRCLDVALGAVPLPLRVLDIGCGYGDMLRECAERVPNLIELAGVDPDPVLLAEARELAGPTVRFYQSTAEELPFEDERFDLIVALNSFREWSNPRRGLAEVARVLHPAGAFVLADHTGADVPAALAGAGLRLMRQEVLARRFGRISVRASIAAR